MKAQLERLAEQIALQPLDVKSVVYRRRRQIAWRLAVLTVASAVLTAALIAGGIAARALVHDDDAVPPGAPLRVQARALGPMEVLVQWKAAAGDTGLTGYEIHRNGSRIETVGDAIRRYIDTTVRPETRYRYRIVALDDAGNRSEPSKAARVTTPPVPAGDERPPSTPTLLTARRAGETEVQLTWTPSEDDVDLDGYTVYRDGTRIDSVGEALTAYTDRGLDPSKSHTYVVDAFDASGNHSALSNALTVSGIDAEAPAAPTEVSAGQDFEQGGVNVTWSPSTDNVGVERYVIFRNGGQVATVDHPTTTYHDPQDPCEGTTTYEVVAVDAAGNESRPGSTQLTVVC